jgi:hypothetical protein
MSEKVPITVVLGIGTDGKAHASRFEPRDQPFAARAAALMGFHVISVSPENDELHGIAAALPLGKIFATGRAFVPFVSRAAFEKLAPLVEGGIGSTKPAAPKPAPDKPAAKPDAEAVSGTKPAKPEAVPDKPAAKPDAEAISSADALWGKIGIGSIVLAEQPEAYGPGWWESVVVGVKGDNLMIRWLDEPDEPPVRMARRNVALRYPEAS